MQTFSSYQSSWVFVWNRGDGDGGGRKEQNADYTWGGEISEIREEK